MEPKIIDKDQIILVGFGFFGDPFASSGGWTEGNEIGRLWQRFETYLTNNMDRIKYLTNQEVGYEVHIHHEETMSKGHYEVFVGMEVEKLEDVPIELLVKILPPAKYAVFTLVGEQITSDWFKMIKDWQLRSGYEQAYNYGFQFYDQRFKGLDKIEESILDVYVPIKLAT